jgi:hypothetical protein
MSKQHFPSGEIRYDSLEEIDEIVARDAAIHIERMAEDQLWMSIRPPRSDKRIAFDIFIDTLDDKLPLKITLVEDDALLCGSEEDDEDSFHKAKEIRDMPRHEAKKLVAEFFSERSGEELYPSDAALALGLDAIVTFNICNELVKEGMLKLPYGTSQATQTEE